MKSTRLKTLRKLSYASILCSMMAMGQDQNSTNYTVAYGSDGICLSNSDGSSVKRLTSGKHGYPAWSPDGKKLAIYAYHDGRKTWSIHTMNSDGTDHKRITHVKFKLDNMPCWSPDGKTLVFAREYWDDNDLWHSELWTMNADGSHQKQIPGVDGGGPFFLADGRVLFHSEHLGKESDISIVDVDGKHLVKLTNDKAEDWDPKPSPDGKRILFSSNIDGDHEIYMMNIDGSNRVQLTHNDFDDSGPVWSPDGTQIIFQTEGGGGMESGLYRMNIDGTQLIRIANKGSQPAWYHKRH